MGNWFSGFYQGTSDATKASAVASANTSVDVVAPEAKRSDTIDEETQLDKKDDIELGQNLETRDDLIIQFGFPSSQNLTSDSFWAHSMDEDSFLVGGGRNRSTHRMVWQNGNRYTVAYLRNNRVVQIFY